MSDSGKSGRTMLQKAGAFLRWMFATIGNHALGLFVAAALATGVIATLVATWASVSAWMVAETRIQGWQLSALVLIAVAALLVIGAAMWNYVSSRRKFRPLEVLDTKFNLLWRITTNPCDWLDKNLDRFSPDYMGSFIDGPFHAVAGCYERLSIRTNSGDELFMWLCFGCDQDVTQQQEGGIKLNELKKGALADLQRLHRQGVSIKHKMELKKPLYWLGLEMPKKASRRGSGS